MPDKNKSESSRPDFTKTLTLIGTIIGIVSGIATLFIMFNSGPAIEIFEATPDEVVLGQSTTLTWSVSDATHVIITPIIGEVSLTGSVEVKPVEKTTFTITAVKEGKEPKSRPLTVSIVEPKPEIEYFEVSPEKIASDQRITLRWSVSNAADVAITPEIGKVDLNGSKVISPTKTTTYTITATNKAGEEVTRNVECKVGPNPEIEFFKADPEHVTPGENTKLSWSVSDATSVTLYPGRENVPLIGTKIVSLNEKTTYTLLAANEFGDVTADAIVDVQPKIEETPSEDVNNEFSDSTNSDINSVGIEFIKIPAGEFMMGSPSDEKYREKDEGPVHKVTIEEPFYLSKFEITQEQWEKVMENNPSKHKGADLPVEGVSWNDAQEFIYKLNNLEGTYKYRLPSEAEWEYACRAGTTTEYSFGNDELKLGDYAWYLNNSEGQTHPVGQKKPNPWGLYDIYGNVWEWVQDTCHPDYNSAPSDGSAWVSGGYSHVARGSSFNRLHFDKSPATAGCRSANRGGGNDTKLDDKGLRLIMEV